MTGSKRVWFTFVESLSELFFHTNLRVKLSETFTKVNNSGILVTSTASTWYTFWNYCYASNKSIPERIPNLIVCVYMGMSDSIIVNSSTCGVFRGVEICLNVEHLYYDC
jgi:hypothetical protein